MDNPQQYQPLSHALNPPIVQPQYEEEEEEEEEGDDEGAVEEQLERADEDGDEHAGPSNSSHPTPSAVAAGKQRDASSSANRQPSNGQPAPDDAERKRRPGRPRGSKNRRPRASGPDASNAQPAGARPPTGPHGFYQYSSPSAPGEVQPHNQQYYEFQWRVLNLCAEFYGAAEELVKETPSLVIAQCYQMGPTVKVDPLTMLSEAKRICDALLVAPAQLTTHPPPPPLTFIPGYTPAVPPPQPPQPTPPVSTNGKTTPAAQTTTTPVITNPQSFVVPMTHHQHPSPQFTPGVYSNPSYPTAPYYGYGGYGGYYQPMPQPAPSTSASSTTPPVSASSMNSAGNQGAWSDEETEKLKKLAEDHRGSNGDIAWDALCEKWGNSRTRHQILIKATSLGLKESSSRGTKRRRDTESHPDRQPPPPVASLQPANTNSIATPATASPPVLPLQQAAQATQPTMVSPASSTPGPSTQPSPAIRHAHTQQQLQQQPQHQQPPHQQPQLQQSPPQQPQPAPPQPRFPYPMPTMAATTSPVISSSTTQQQQDRQGTTNTYYRRQHPPATTTGSKPPPQPHAHAGVAPQQYMYQPNGRREP
ncbi:hypothetical protein ID866_7588 [Astraeus odoratus]|nr:hypothetical protein ID866_7588 [Astraeus odoratus]